MEASTRKTWPDCIAHAWESVLRCNLASSQTQHRHWQVEYASQFHNLEKIEIDLQKDWTNKQARQSLDQAQLLLQQVRQQFKTPHKVPPPS